MFGIYLWLKWSKLSPTYLTCQQYILSPTSTIKIDNFDHEAVIRKMRLRINPTLSVCHSGDFRTCCLGTSLLTLETEYSLFWTSSASFFNSRHLISAIIFHQNSNFKMRNVTKSNNPRVFSSNQIILIKSLNQIGHTGQVHICPDRYDENHENSIYWTIKT